MFKKKIKQVDDPYEMYLYVFQERMEAKDLQKEDAYKHYDVPGVQAILAVSYGLAHAEYAAKHLIEMHAQPSVPWTFEKFQAQLITMFTGYQNAKLERQPCNRSL